MTTAIILAAGRGNRLKPLSNTMPKPLTEVNGTPILFNALDNLELSGVQRICLVTGYLHDRMFEACGRHHGKMDIDYVVNHDYATTNNAYSLWLARDEMADGCYLLEADIFFDRDVFERLTQCGGPA
jgi:choline kinase